MGTYFASRRCYSSAGFGRFLPVVLAALLAAGCSSSDDDDDGLEEAIAGKNSGAQRACTLDEEKQKVLQIMQQWYLWNDEAAQADKYAGIDLDAFGDGGELLGFLRFRPDERDRGFSHITTPEEEAAFFGEGEFVGFGFSFIEAGAGDVYFSQVYAGSPADDAGIERGYRLEAIDGRDVSLIQANEGISAALGPSEEGVTRTLQVADRSGTVLSPMELTKRTVTIDPVPVAKVFNDAADNPTIGYLVLRTFIGPAETALREAFEEFTGVDTLIVDLRYNGGGRVDVAALFASLLAGPANAGNIFVEFEYNSDRSDQNQRAFFSQEPEAIDLDTIVFITTNFSASASELVINGLQPYFSDPKTLAGIGSSTFGKPVGQSAFDFCDETKRLRPVTFRSVNRDGDGDFFDGLPVDCSVGDDLQAPFGDENESMLSAALSYAENGSCPGIATTRRTVAAEGGAGNTAITGGSAPWERYAGAH
jgi:C-terminal processing protease CtpA/Prc